MVQQIQLKQEKGFQIYAKTFGNFSMICVTNNPCTGITTLQVEHLCLDKPFNRVKKDSSDFTPYEGKNIAR